MGKKDSLALTVDETKQNKKLKRKLSTTNPKAARRGEGSMRVVPEPLLIFPGGSMQHKLKVSGHICALGLPQGPVVRNNQRPFHPERW